MDLKQHLIRQMVFSKATFGPGPRTKGVIDHIKKELIEVELSNGSPTEWVDVVILALDGLTRSIWSQRTHTMYANEAAQMACNHIERKQCRNELRDWPDWRTADPEKAIEHVKNLEEKADE